MLVNLGGKKLCQILCLSKSRFLVSIYHREDAVRCVKLAFLKKGGWMDGFRCRSAACAKDKEGKERCCLSLFP